MKIAFKRASLFSPDLMLVRSIYNTSFPDNERAPFWLLAARAVKKNVDFWFLYDKERHKCIGMLYVVTHADIGYIFYFAIDEAVRGMGYGSAVLKAAMRYYKDIRLFLSIERLDEPCDNYDQRFRRRSFYLRNGFKDQHLHIKEANVIFDMLGVGEPPTKAEYDRLVDSYFGFMRKYITMKIL